MPPENRAYLSRVGIDLEGERAGTYLQVDQNPLFFAGVEGLDILSLPQAREAYPWVDGYVGRLLPQARPLDPRTPGYFIRVGRGMKIDRPVQVSLIIGREGGRQEVHNVIILEEGASLNLIIGCTSGACVRRGIHLSSTETFVGRRARLHLTMIHHWGPEVEVYPQGATWVEEQGAYMYDYVCLSGARKLVTNPQVLLAGEGGIMRSQTVLVSPPGSSLDVGSQVYLRASGTRAEMVSRALTTGGEVVSRGLLAGEVSGVRGHLECHGLLLTPQGRVLAVPELEAKTSQVELSHEAAVGQVEEEAIEYLLARGFPRQEAVSIIVRGFLNVGRVDLPPALKEEIDRVIRLTAEAH